MVLRTLFGFFKVKDVATQVSSEPDLLEPAAFSSGGDLPVISPSAGRFFIAEDRRSDLAYVNDVLRASARDADDLFKRFAAYSATAIPMIGEDPRSDERVDLFEALVSLAGGTTRRIVFADDMGAARGVEVEVDGEWRFFDPAHGLIFADADERTVSLARAASDPATIPLMVVDRVWGGMPFSGLILKYGPVPDAHAALAAKLRDAGKATDI